MFYLLKYKKIRNLDDIELNFKHEKNTFSLFYNYGDTN